MKNTPNNIDSTVILDWSSTFYYFLDLAILITIFKSTSYMTALLVSASISIWYFLSFIPLELIKKGVAMRWEIEIESNNDVR
jgi:hypothetical protein